MSKRNSRSKRAKSFLPWWVWVVLLLVTWLVLATVAQKSPTQAVVDGYRGLMGEEPLYPSQQQQQKSKQVYLDSIAALQLTLAKIKTQNPYRKAIVNTEANSLNLRAESNIASDVVIKIPDSSVVEVLYFDEEVLMLEGEAGKWCKIRYADKEGWVWGNYVQLLD